jgi:hypothetical protein
VRCELQEIGERELAIIKRFPKNIFMHKLGFPYEIFSKDEKIFPQLFKTNGMKSIFP